MKKLFASAAFLFALMFALPLGASALTVGGVAYDHSMWCDIVTGGFGQIRDVNLSNDDGQTANLLGTSGTGILCYGYWYNSDLGIAKSKQVGAGQSVNGGSSATVLKSAWQAENINTGVGFQGTLQSPYRGISRSIDQDVYSPDWQPKYTNLVWSFFLLKNSVSAQINGLDSSDASQARVVITGTGLPNATSYGSSGTYKKSGTTSVDDTVNYGHYYASVYIPNADKYNVTYSVYYVRGDKYSANNNDINTYNYTGSGSFSTPSYYIESGGQFKVVVTVQKKGTVIVDMYKGTGVTESYGGKPFNLYNASGSCLGQASTDSGGYAYFHNLPYGAYTFRPASTPADCYYDPTSVNVTLNSDLVTGKITLYRSTGTLKINYTTEDGLNLGDVRFTVTDPNGSTGNYYTDSGGHISIDPAITGTYRIQQVSAPNGYERYLDTATVTVSRSSTTTVTFYNPILYDFAVSLSAPSTVEQMQPLTATAVFRNNSPKSATGVPVQIGFNGSLVYSDAISIPAYGSVTKTVSLDTSSVGAKTLWASVNENGAKNETNMADNYASQTITITTSTNLRIQFITPNSEYREDTDVLSSYRVYNDGYNDITPGNSLSVRLSVSYAQNGVSKSVAVPDKDAAVIPYGGDNIVYFKWHVPDGTAGLSFKLTATVNAAVNVDEKNYADDTATVYRIIEESPYSETPDTRYEASQPGGWSEVSAPSEYETSGTWSEWSYVNGAFVKKTYGVGISLASAPAITPDSSLPSAVYENGQWNIKSGYGFSLALAPALASIGGTSYPSSDAYTAIQRTNSLFPEFSYSTAANQYRTLQLVSGVFQFFTNSYAAGKRLHYIPVWYPNGSYTVSCSLYDLWTPAGMLSASINSNPFNIDGSLYDDYYVGGKP